MAATTVTFSTTIEAQPQLLLNRYHNGGLRVAAHTVEVATTSLDEVDDRVMLLALPGSARIIDLVLFNDDLDSNGSPLLTVDFGLFYGDGVIGQDVGTAIDDDCLATAITTLQAANTLGVRIGYEVCDIAKIGKPLWEIAGLTKDPGGLIYIGMSVAAVAGTAAAGTVSVYCLYV